MESLYTFPIDLTANQTNYYWFEKGFSPEELTEIERLVSNIDFVRGQTQGDDEFTENEDRKSNIKWVPITDQYKWIYDKIGEMAYEANQNLYHFDLHNMPENIQYTEYYDHEKGHYDWHMDIGPFPINNRKISITIQLSDPDDYIGGDLEIWTGNGLQTCARQKGAALLFPSYMLHRVTPVTSGTRKSLVLWVGGSPYR